MMLSSYICNGNGNSFVIILHYNNLKKDFFDFLTVQKICLYNQKNVDGLVVINIKSDNIFIDYFNNDGSWETLCLNGLRCASLILSKINHSKTINLVCNDKIYKTKVLENNMILVELSKPVYKLENIQLNNLVGNYIDLGEKHFDVT